MFGSGNEYTAWRVRPRRMRSGMRSGETAHGRQVEARGEQRQWLGRVAGGKVLHGSSAIHAVGAKAGAMSYAACRATVNLMYTNRTTNHQRTTYNERYQRGAARQLAEAASSNGNVSIQSEPSPGGV